MIKNYVAVIGGSVSGSQAAYILAKNSMPESVFQNISDKTKAYQEKVGYKNYQDWIQSKVPVRLENMK